MSPNQIRAEKLLNFPNNVDYKAKMTLDVVMSIESALGKSIMKVATKLSEADVPMSDVLIILTLAIRGGGNDIKDNDVKALINQMGLVQSIKMCGDLLALALSSGDEIDEKKSELSITIIMSCH